MGPISPQSRQISQKMSPPTLNTLFRSGPVSSRTAAPSMVALSSLVDAHSAHFVMSPLYAAALARARVIWDAWQVQHLSYLDAIFGGLQRFGERRRASSRWVSCARRTVNLPWRLAFLREARRSHEDARRLLDDVALELGPIPARVRALGASDSPPPLEALAGRLVALREELDGEERKLGALEVELATNEGPRGVA